MRNLQKILALVLALIMSFSLVATAGAFSDDGDISDAYKDAVTVLNGLEVFKGYDNGATFQPKGNITRAEVAAIIYRIATGDVTDSQASIYTSYNQFTDVLDGSWYSGYVNYCANAGYIKGRGNKIFDPQSSVTGYEALAMILRAVGYDKNGEFTGSNWQIRTASIANEKEITKNVTSAQLGQAATREMVAEILFRSIIIPQVNFNANTLSYTDKPLNADGKKDTLGYASLKLEEIEGVVTANEYADLEDTDTLAAGRTRMHVDGADARDYTLDITSTLDDIGESRIAYIQNGNLSKVFVLSSTGDNVVYDDGKDIDVDDARKEAKPEGSDTTTTLKLDDNTQYFRNYDPIEQYEAKWRIEYVYKMSDTALAAAKDLALSDTTRTKLVNGRDAGILYHVNADGTRGDPVTPLTIADADRGTMGTYEYVKVIPAGEKLSETDKKCIREIFRIADYQNGSYIDGEVYVGTTSQAKLDDISDDISYTEFVNTYINIIEDDEITSSDLGYRLKLIDNNDDTIVDYVLQTVYTVTKIDSVSSDNKYTLMTKNVSLPGIDEVNNVDKDTNVVKFNADDELKAGDVVLYAVIDGKAQTWLAKSESAKIDKIDRANKKVTTTDGTEYADSDVNVRPKNDNETVAIGLGDSVVDMTGNNTYSLYFDLYGNLAAFNEADEEFVLVVDGWYNSTKGGSEYAVKVWQDGSIQTKDVTSSGELFIEDGLNNDWNQIRRLGAANANGGKALNADLTLANGDKDPKDDNIRTTVALLNSDGVLTPVDMAYHTIKRNAMIAMDNDQLPDRVGKTGKIYNTRTNINERAAYNNEAGDANVQALSSTKYYFVYNAYSDWTGKAISKVVREYTGYQNLPKNIEGDPNYLDHVEDVYVVGTLARSATNVEYYTADVVVVELDDSYYKTLGGEQVFIPYFPVVGTSVTREEVDVIRQDGTKDSLTLDLTRSDIRYYDDAKGVSTRMPGLYYMWQSDVDNDVYYVRYMKPADIEASERYYVGMVNYSRSGNGIGTLPSNYVDVDVYGKSTVDGSLNSLGGTQRANDVASSKYYTLKYNSSRVATLTETSREAALTQRPEADRSRADYCNSVFNEYTVSGGYQLNEVLVAYNVVNGYEEIAYVVSFNEYQSYDGPNTREHVHDFAQDVWSECLSLVGGVTPDSDAEKVAAAKAALDGKVFTAINVPYDETDDAAYVIGDIVAQANAALTAAGSDLVITAADVTIGDLSELTSETPLTGVAVTIALKSGDVTGSAVASVDVSKDAAPEEYTLAFDAALQDGTFDVTVNGVIAADGAAIAADDVIVLNPAAALEATGIDETGKVTGNVTVSAKEGFTYSNMFGGWMGVNDAGDLITVPYDPTAAAGMRARAAADDTIPTGPVDTTEDGWFGKVVRDYGATYTITVDTVVWEGKITEGGTTWKLVEGTVEEAKAAISGIDSAVVEKTAMAPEEPTESKLVVEPVTGRTPLIAGDSTIAANIQEGIQVEKQADGTTYNVTGNVFYTKNWTAYNNTNCDGYFVALKITHPDVGSSMILLNRGTAPFDGAATSKYLNDDGILVYKVAVKDNKADSFTATVMLDDGTREVSTIDLSGLTLGEDTSELTVEAVDPNGKDSVQWGVDVADLQSNVTVDPAENGVIKVHGTAKYFADETKTDWATNWDDLKTGYFVALKLNFPGVADDGIKIFYTDNNGNPTDGEGGNHRPMSDGDILLWRIKPSTAMKPINNIKVEVEGKTYTIDISDVTLRGTTMTLSAVTDDSINLLNKKASDLQSDIVVSEPVGNRITVTGTSKYITNWTDFSTSNNSGNFVALQISWPGVQNDQIDYGWDATDRNADTDGLFVFRLQNGDVANQPMKTMKFKANGITYEVDLSGITREPGTANGLVIDNPRDGESVGGDNGKVSDYNVEAISVDGYTVSGGRLGYQAGLKNEADSNGYYVALYVTEGSNAVSEIYWREVGSSVSARVTAESGVCLLPVKVGKDMFRDNKQYTSLEIAPVKNDSADWGSAVTVDLSGLTNLGVVPTAESYPEDENFKLGSLSAPGSTYQTITKVSGPDENNVITVEGSLNWIAPNGAYGDDEDSGYYGIIRFKVDPEVKSVFTLHKIHETGGTPDGSTQTGWKDVPVNDGFLDLMTHVASWSGEKPENTVLYVDGVKYEINWNVTLNAQPMPASALD